MLQVIKTLEELSEFRNSLNQKTLALIPSMGALHEGHLALVRQGIEMADVCMPYIFVNPTQFAPNEDFDTYPRNIEDDIKKLESVGVSVVWIPSIEDIYPNGQETDVHISGVSEPLEGEFRPHFFDGVATVLARMFRLSRPDIVILGEKDFQQLQVVRKMVAQENIDVEIVGAPIVRDENGLALSSRNAYLSENEYEVAIQLNKILLELSVGDITEIQAREKLIQAGFDKVDYCTKRNAQTLDVTDPERVLAAAWIGKTRLIDNMAIR